VGSLAGIVAVLAFLSGQFKAVEIQASPTTPAPFLYPPYLGEGSVSTIFDHQAPLYSGGGNDVNRLVAYNGTVAVCPTNTPAPPPTAGPSPTPRCQSGTSYEIPNSGGLYLSYDGHNGLDFPIDYQPVIAAADVVAVERAGWRRPNDHRASYGLYAVLRHPNGYRTLYGHLAIIDLTVCDPCNYSRGHIIGVGGNTGDSTGPHLHFSVFNRDLEPVLDSDAAAVDPYGWQGGGTPVWGNNQVNSLWVQRPHIGAIPYIGLPGGTALPMPTIDYSVTVDNQDTPPAVIIINGSNCTWSDIGLAYATNGRMLRLKPESAGVSQCIIYWNRPAGLPRGLYQVYAHVPRLFTWPNPLYDAADAAIYRISHSLANNPNIQQVDQAIVSQSQVLTGGTILANRAYLGTYYFAGGSADEYVYLGNVITGAVTDTTRLGADSIFFVPAPNTFAYASYVVNAWALPTSTPPPSPTQTPTPPPPTRTSTPTATYTPTQIPPTRTPTATRTPLPTATGTPPQGNCDSNSLLNSDFETGSLPPWQGAASNGQSLIARDPVNNDWSARLAGYNTAQGRLYQGALVPAGADSVQLSLAWYLTTTEASTTNVYDTMTVTLRSPFGVIQDTPLTVTNLSVRNQWTVHTSNLTIPPGWQGQDMWVYFSARTDTSLPSAFYLDNVWLTFTCGGPQDLPTPTPAPQNGYFGMDNSFTWLQWLWPSPASTISSP
jgi:murein DD-endopeptidase MepM/ murein hydrolase activator NlpD